MIYEARIVSFFDLLGFKAAMLQPQADLEILVQAIRDFRSGFDYMRMNKDDDDVIFRTFSDSALRAARKTVGIGFEMESHALGIAKLFLDGYPVRGGITVGDFYDEKSGDDESAIVISPAFVRAVELESQACYPRVIFDPKIFSLMREKRYWEKGVEDKQRFDSSMKKDADGFYFVDYLAVILRLNAQEDPWAPPSYFSEHKGKIEEAIAYHRGRDTWPKYQWLATYHNSTLQELIALSNPSWAADCLVVGF